MTDVPNLRRHANLVDRMSRAVGLDLEEEILRGNLQIESLGDAVLCCGGCANVESCARWLAERDDPAGSAPDYCRNKALFSALKKGRRV
ncbi:hypothetical protein D6850_02400 [Roseovarius spongiae]|uniref:DUF6455 domain-containing protein n=1 Tax=Roseovarius spongiae TaxID=2320272 RepID=A0A3A8AXF6_9RHOB|nr:DUF6455 family protein [Roseovarius spongiae]RKF16426.1 hypothetical protein D6850_02400 [Roseovarius spongiae]